MGRIAAGDLTERVSLQQPTAAVPDGQGGFLKGGVNVTVTVYAKVRVVSGTEALRLGQTLGSRVVQAVVRYYPAATSSTTLTWEGKSLAVQQVVHDNRKEFTTLTCVDNGRN